MSTIGERIRQRRIELNMSQEELAIKIGYNDRSSIAKIESGERDIRQRKIIDLANALNTTPNWLMGYNVTVIRPELTAEERAERQKKVENCIANFWLAVQKTEQKQRSERNASSDHD